MKEPKRRPLDPSTPKIPQVKTIPMPSVYPEPMQDDVVSEGAEQAFFNFIQKAKESKRKYNERLEKFREESSEE